MAEPSSFPQGKHRYRSVAEGMAMAQAFLRSGLCQTEFARQHGITLRMVKYWSGRARQLAMASEAAVACPTPPLLEHVAGVDDGGRITTNDDSPLPPVPVPIRCNGTAAIEVRLTRGLSIAVTPGFSPALLRQIVACLDGDESC